MNPALSVIVFTTLSGMGYGLLVLIGTLHLFGRLPITQMALLTLLIVAFICITAGLLSSTLHLHHKSRAWRALGQWRSSWLSREGVMALITFIPLCLMIYGVLYQPNIVSVAAPIAALCALITIYTTAMLYASLKTIAAWHQRIVPVIYIVCALVSGGVLLVFLSALLGQVIDEILLSSVLFFMVLLIVFKKRYWSKLDTDIAQTDADTATGLGGIGKVRSLESPHTSPNWLMKEMGFRVARKHTLKLRRLVVWLLSLSVLALLVVAFIGGSWLTVLVFVLMVLAIATERWLFFAEAKHVVMNYY